MFTADQLSRFNGFRGTNEKIQAIKYFRELTGDGLKESKAAVDQFFLTGHFSANLAGNYRAVPSWEFRTRDVQVFTLRGLTEGAAKDIQDILNSSLSYVK